MRFSKYTGKQNRYPVDVEKKNMWEIVWFTFQVLPGRHEYESEVLKVVLVPDVVQLVAEELLLNILIRLINVRGNGFFKKKLFYLHVQEELFS